MKDNVKESSHARCEVCRILKTVRMIEQSATNREIIHMERKATQL